MDLNFGLQQLDLPLIWYILLGILMSGYAILDGFDLGVGILHPLAQTDQERRIFINTIGPIWDGNEVWLVTFGGALFAAFPEAYATAFSAFYIPFMLLLFALIFRAVSIEFRSKMESALWRTCWDYGFFLSSLLASILFGVAVGNMMIGIPLDARGIFTGDILTLLSPYTILLGLLTASLFTMHGTLFLHLKVPYGGLHQRTSEWMWHAWGMFLVLFLLATIYTFAFVPRAIPNFERAPWASLIIFMTVLSVANIPRSIYMKLPGQAFLSSSILIISLVCLFGMALWPNLITASNQSGLSLTIYNASSSLGTLNRMLIIACIGMPLVLIYLFIIYWTFRKRVEIEEHSY
ncbi:MAG: cytochrome d ubiquinol oxidase subunit II [Oligoflexia bacterium]|nr:cytochrome d ubiquinol oxidase subunit II [Oligoflexia bacterium]